MAEDKRDQEDELSGADSADDEALADEWAAALEQQQDEEQGSSVEDDWAAAMAEAEAAEQSAAKADDDVRQAPMESFTESAPVQAGAPDLDVILDIPVTISMEVGNTQIAIRNLLQLNQGSVIELDRLAGEPLDVLVNGTLIAHGEVVMVNEKFGIRLTDVISPTERIKKLRG
ncbi:flagellar motor switch protein FliN [Hahella sp. CCB-MM4]|uniref:flagellar motor switch protein FliN n=1 Tax=Hahella sp. (strain CCB-MM4) TaxID=1926491 RepID=UPI000B9AB15B|nr:flagellar motor switch protein FliN [Hahella sp. CCB-MM4]OZG72881.1 flagellar motor switch protein FliN [Hahella sp. CCB-MM4]